MTDHKIPKSENPKSENPFLFASGHDFFLRTVGCCVIHIIISTNGIYVSRHYWNHFSSGASACYDGNRYRNLNKKKNKNKNHSHLDVVCCNQVLAVPLYVSQWKRLKSYRNQWLIHLMKKELTEKEYLSTVKKTLF